MYWGALVKNVLRAGKKRNVKVCDESLPDLCSTRFSKARKTYYCEECSRKIIPGEKYERAFTVSDGENYTYKICSQCADLKNYVQKNSTHFCWNAGDMINCAIETAQEQLTLPGQLFGAYRRKIRIEKALLDQHFQEVNRA